MEDETKLNGRRRAVDVVLPLRCCCVGDAF